MSKIDPKDPGARLPYRIDWSDWLEEGDKLEESTWDVPEGLESDLEDFDDTTAVIWLAGGIHRRDYVVTNRVVMLSTMINEQSFTLHVRNK